MVLVCGDTTSLFPPDTVYRETRQGWYIHAQNAEQLPLLAQHLAAVRPALVSQVSVLLALIPEQQTSEEALAQTLRGWRRSITQCRNWLNGVPPVWSVAWCRHLTFTLKKRRSGLPSHRSYRACGCGRTDMSPCR